MDVFDNLLTKNIQLVHANELAPNAGHVGVVFRNCLLIWGGYNYDKEGQYYRDPRFLYIYPYKLFGPSNVYIKYKLHGNIPRATTAASGIVQGDILYIFGGNVVFEDAELEAMRNLATPTNKLYTLDLRRGKWTLVDTTGQKTPTPRDKAAGFGCDEGLFFFGGYGPSHRLLQKREQYLYTNYDYYEDEELSNCCWNNQMVHYDGKNWKLIKQSGDIPNHRAAAAISYNPKTNKAYLFGGRHSTVRLNDLYEFDVDTYKWRTIHFGEGIRAPVGRSWASLTYNPDGEYFLLYGGISENDYPLNDRVKLTFDKSEYCQAEVLEMSKTVPEKRLWHTTVYLDGSFISYGGMKGSPNGALPPCTGTTDIVSVCPSSLQALTIRKVSEVYGESFHWDSLPHILRAKFAILLAKQRFLKSIEGMEFRSSENGAVMLDKKIKRQLPEATSALVLFNALDF